MTVATIEPDVETPPALERRPLAASEYLHLAAAGCFDRERIELIEGEILKMSPIGSPHGWLVGYLTRELVALAGDRHFLGVQSTLPLNDRTVVEPDFYLLRGPGGGHREPHPGPADVLLVVEVAESSLNYDLRVKSKLYARSGIGEYWVVAVERRTVVVHRDPTPSGYRDVAEHPADARIQIAGSAELCVDFARVFR